MSDRSLIFTLAKVIIAAAWADGEVTHDEINSLKDLLFQLPNVGLKHGIQLSAQEWARLEMYIESPIGDAERARLIADLKAELRTPRDKELVVLALDNLVKTDGVVTDEEKEIEAEIKQAMEDVDVSILGQLGRLVGGAVQRRSAAVAQSPNREQFLEDYIKNKVYYAVRQRLRLDEKELHLPEADLRKLSLAGGLLAKVAHVDEHISEDEFEAIARALQTHWQVDRETAVFIAEVATSEVAKKLDHHRTVRQFATNTTRAERVHFLDVLFAVAVADGRVSFDETEEIRAIANSMNLTHKDFIDAKLKIPRERRDA
jgi:uncharacterized tellurite resistance protein B-like protein